MLELGGITGLKIKPRQSTLMELRELGHVMVVPSLPSIKSYFHLNTFLMA